MRVGSLLNSFKLMPLMLYDCYELDFEKYSRIYWLAKHSPNFMLRMALRLFEIEYHDPKLNLRKMFTTCLSFENQVEEVIKACRPHSPHLEFSCDLIFLTEDFKRWFARFLPYLVGLRRRGVTFSVHLPQFAGMFFETYLKHMRGAAIEELREIVEFFSDLNPLFVLHLGGGERIFHYVNTHGDDPVVEQELNRIYGGHFWPRRSIEKRGAKFVIGDAMSTAERFLENDVIIENLLDSLERVSRFLPLERLCLENLERGPYDPIVKPLIKVTPVSVCIDVGHFTIKEWPFKKKSFDDHFRDFGHRSKIIHMHQVVEIGSETYGNISRSILQDHKPLDVENGLVPVDEILRLAKNTCKKNREDVIFLVELYYRDPLPSLRNLAQRFGLASGQLT